jgi:hypothetical protein
MPRGDFLELTKALLDSFADRLPENRVARLTVYVEVGEWEEFAYGLLAALDDPEIAVTPRDLDLLTDLLYSFDLPVSSYPLLNNRVRYLEEIGARVTPAE